MSHALRTAVCLAVLTGAAAAGAADPETTQPSVFDLPRLQAAQAVTGKAVAELFSRGDYANAAKILEQVVEKLPFDFSSRYNLACAQARLGKKDEALASLEKAVELGFRDAKKIEEDQDLASLRNDARFQAVVKKAAEPLTEKPEGWHYKVEPAPVVDGRVTVSEKNTIWQPQLGLFRSFFQMDKAGADQPIGDMPEAAWMLVRKWYQEGTAAGNRGDLYDNHDGGHSILRNFPQMTRIEFSEEVKKRGLDRGLQLAFLYNGITIGNSSMALTGGPFWRSQPRMALTRPGGAMHLYLQYISSHLYFYPEHKDYDPKPEGAKGAVGGDLYPANTPYMIISQGSSGTDQPFLQAVSQTLGALRPEVKQKLAKSGMLMAAVQLVFRASNKRVEKAEDYLSGKAHPAVFQASELDPVKMVTLAHDITLETLPPMVQLKVVEEDEGLVGRDYFDVGARERIFDTPCAIARVVRSTKYSHRMVLSAEGSKDLNNKPLVFHWAVLCGDPAKIKIRKLDDAGARVELVVDYQERHPIEPGSKMTSNRVDIGVFASNGVRYSAPGFVSFYYLDNETRVYDKEHRILSVDYRRSTGDFNYVDPLLDLEKDWLDEYHYDKAGTLLGWTRIRGNDREEFTPQGELILEKSSDGSPKKTCAVRYVAEGSGNQVPRLQEQRVE